MRLPVLLLTSLLGQGQGQARPVVRTRQGALLGTELLLPGRK